MSRTLWCIIFSSKGSFDMIMCGLLVRPSSSPTRTFCEATVFYGPVCQSHKHLETFLRELNRSVGGRPPPLYRCQRKVKTVRKRKGAARKTSSTLKRKPACAQKTFLFFFFLKKKKTKATWPCWQASRTSGGPSLKEH